VHSRCDSHGRPGAPCADRSMVSEQRMDRSRRAVIGEWVQVSSAGGRIAGAQDSVSDATRAAMATPSAGATDALPTHALWDASSAISRGPSTSLAGGIIHGVGTAGHVREHA